MTAGANHYFIYFNKIKVLSNDMRLDIRNAISCKD